MLIIKKATSLPLHTFMTIFLNYSVVMFWSSSSLLLSVSTPGSTSFVQSSNCPFTGSLNQNRGVFADILCCIEIELLLCKLFDQIQGHVK